MKNSFDTYVRMPIWAAELAASRARDAIMSKLDKISRGIVITDVQASLVADPGWLNISVKYRVNDYDLTIHDLEKFKNNAINTIQEWAVEFKEYLELVGDICKAWLASQQ